VSSITVLTTFESACAAGQMAAAIAAGLCRRGVVSLRARTFWNAAYNDQFKCLHSLHCVHPCRASAPRTRSELLRHYTLELAFLFLSKNTEQDMSVAWGIPEAKLLEVGLPYELQPQRGSQPTSLPQNARGRPGR